MLLLEITDEVAKQAVKNGAPRALLNSIYSEIYTWEQKFFPARSWKTPKLPRSKPLLFNTLVEAMRRVTSARFREHADASAVGACIAKTLFEQVMDDLVAQMALAAGAVPALAQMMEIDPLGELWTLEGDAARALAVIIQFGDDAAVHAVNDCGAAKILQNVLKRGIQEKGEGAPAQEFALNRIADAAAKLESPIQESDASTTLAQVQDTMAELHNATSLTTTVEATLRLQSLVQDVPSHHPKLTAGLLLASGALKVLMRAVKMYSESEEVQMVVAQAIQKLLEGANAQREVLRDHPGIRDLLSKYSSDKADKAAGG